ncbi:MAG: GNAT family N-acetyltransferase [Sphaerochaetaceae bacterium]
MDYYKVGNGFAYGEQNEIPLARITMRPLGKKRIAIDHTYVSPSLRGQGIARKLVMLVVEYAKTEGVQIVPLCSYAQMILEEDPELAKLIAD